MNGERDSMTVGALIDQLLVYPRDAEVSFGGGADALTFYRFKLRGENLVQLEFNEQVYRDKSGELVLIEA